MNVRESIVGVVRSGLLGAVGEDEPDRQMAEELFRKAEREFEPYIDGLVSVHMISPVSNEHREHLVERHKREFALYLSYNPLSGAFVRHIVYRLSMEASEQLHLLHSADSGHRRFQLQPAV